MLTPVWNKKSQEWEVESDNPDHECDGGCPLFGLVPNLPKGFARAQEVDRSDDNILKELFALEVLPEDVVLKCMHTPLYKGMMVNSFNKTCMNNDDLLYALRTIVDDILDGQKVDICGLDMCMGSMLEHGYQLCNYVNYLVGSQECEMADGWNYTAFMETLSSGNYVSPQHLASTLVTSYKDYYADVAPVGQYTQSAFALSYMDALRDSIDHIVTCIQQCIKDDPAIQECVRAARQRCLRFCLNATYCDICNFYDELCDELSGHTDDNVKKLLQALKDGRALVEQAVVANVTGPKSEKAHGISIYFPFKHIDSSYPSVLFAQDSLWLGFIESMLE